MSSLVGISLKQQANHLFTSGNLVECISLYTQCLVEQLSPQDKSAVFANRALCYFKLENFDFSLKDAEESIKICPEYVKGYLRKAMVCVEMKNEFEAVKNACIALALDGKLLKDAVFVKQFPNLSRLKITDVPKKDRGSDISLTSTLYVHLLEPCMTSNNAAMTMLDLALSAYDVIVLKPGDHAVSMGEIKTKKVILGLGLVNVKQQQRTMGTTAAFEVLHQNVFIENLIITGEDDALHVGCDLCSLDSIDCYFEQMNQLKSFDSLSETKYEDIPSLFQNGVVLRNCNLKTSNANRKPIITIRKGFVHLGNCRISNNPSGDGIMIRGQSVLLLKECVIEKNDRIGLSISHGAKVRIDNVQICGNSQGVVGWQHCNSIQLFNSDILWNSHEGILITDPPWNEQMIDNESPSLNNSIIEISTRKTRNPDFIFHRCTVSNNYGYGITLQSLHSPALVLISNCLIRRNGQWGLFIHDGISATVDCCSVLSNICGGVRIGLNYDSSVILKNNSICYNFGFAIFSDFHDAPRHSFLSQHYLEALQSYNNKVKEQNSNDLMKPPVPFTAPPFVSENKCFSNVSRYSRKLLQQWFDLDPAISFVMDQQLIRPNDFENILNMDVSDETFNSVFFPTDRCSNCQGKIINPVCCNKCSLVYCCEECKIEHNPYHSLVCSSCENFPFEIVDSKKVQKIVFTISKPTDVEELNLQEKFLLYSGNFLVRLETTEDAEGNPVLRICIPRIQNQDLLKGTSQEISFTSTQSKLYQWVMVFGNLDIMNLASKTALCKASWDSSIYENSPERKRIKVGLIIDVTSAEEF